MTDSCTAMPAGGIHGGNAGGGARAPVRLAAGALVLLCLLVPAGHGWPQVPDNRGVKLDPEDPVSQAYRDTLDRRDRDRLQDAREEGHSFLPVFLGAGQEPGGEHREAPSSDGAAGADAVAARPARVERARPAPVYETAGQFEERGGQGDALAAMVGVLIEGWTQPPQIARLRYAPAGERPAGKLRPSGSPDADAAIALPAVAAGEGFYARTLYAVDSDYPGPVVLELLQPPLEGAVVHGGFERAGTRLVLRLTSLTWRGRTVPVDAWAVDPDCACYGIEGEVDRHFLSRVVLPAAARFAEGFLSAIAMPARTLTFDDGAVLQERAEAGSEEALYAGLGAATRTLGDIFMADAPREATVRIPRNTPLVVMMARQLAASPGAAASGPGMGEEADAGP